MPDPITGTNSDKIDALAQQVAAINVTLARMAEQVGQVPELRREVSGIASTLAVWNRVWSVGVPLLATLVAFLVYQGFATAGRVDLLGSKVDNVAVQVADLKATASAMLELRERIARLEARLSVPRDPVTPAGMEGPSRHDPRPVVPQEGPPPPSMEKLDVPHPR